MKQRAGRSTRHAVIPIGCARRYALEQTEYAAHAFDFIERRHKMHLGRAGIGEANLHAVIDERSDQTFGAIHR